MQLNYLNIFKATGIAIIGFLTANLIGYIYIRLTLEQHLSNPDSNLVYSTSRIIVSVINLIIIYGSFLAAGYFLGKNGIKKNN